MKSLKMVLLLVASLGMLAYGCAKSDDSDGSIFPEAEEICDGFDNNCNGQADEGVTVTYFADSDNDGFGSPNITTASCTQPEGYAVTGTDCDDTDANRHPNATETAGDGIDSNCNGNDDD